MTDRLLLATDLDGTLLPNGPEPETPGARDRFRSLAERPELRIAYVTGRHREIVEDAIGEYSLPVPAFVIADVGTTLYEITSEGWRPDPRWAEEIAADWSNRPATTFAALLNDLPELRPQELEKQSDHKLSYYTDLGVDPERLAREVRRRLDAAGLPSSVIFSVDEALGRGLLDVLPLRADKRRALEFLLDRLGFDRNAAVFAGDSGNDLAVLTSPLRTVLVANARDEVKRTARELAPEGSLYVAEGGWRGMNGNYAAGILEGLAHFEPVTAGWYE